VIGSTRRVRVWACSRPVDLRKGFDGLAYLVSGELGRDPLSGELFLFVSRDRQRAKVLLWDGTGLCIYAKRLERGRFACLWGRGADAVMTLTMAELQVFLEGSSLVGRVEISPPALELGRGSEEVVQA
jgi:transposase